jgi:hypothetical protein
MAAPLALAACGAHCDRNPDIPPVEHTDGITDRAAGFYESSPVEGPYLNFPAGRTYDFVHGLGQTPAIVIPYLSFERCPMPKACDSEDDESSNITIGAGNQVVVENQDEERIRIRNDTCSGIYLRVTAMVGGGLAAADGGLP